MHYFTSEHVTPGHPDKVADIISDAILDKCLQNDSNSKVAVETMVARNHVILAGEITSIGFDFNDLDEYIRYIVSDYIGYNYPHMKFNGDDIVIDNYISEQSKEIYNKVNPGNGTICAGDQGIIFGAADARYDKKTYMPIEWRIASDLSSKLYSLHEKYPDAIYPDGKTQVTCEYNGNDISISNIIVSFSHADVDEDKYIDLKNIIWDDCIMDVLRNNYFWLRYKNAMLDINSKGKFTVCGPDADTGLTGRKIVVDGYGGKFPTGGGAFSGKDATKVDRCAALLARHIALTLVSTDIVDCAQVQLSYAIGAEDPVSFDLQVSGVHNISHVDRWKQKLIKKIIKNYNMSVHNIINKYQLQNSDFISYKDLAKNGHFGRPELLWERPDNDLLEIIYTV